MKLLKAIEHIFKFFLPSPFTIAIFITLVTFLLAFFLTDSDLSTGARSLELVNFWYDGMWKESMLAFALQMMLMLVLGHTLALTKPVDQFMQSMTVYCTNSARAAFTVTLLTILVSLFNWGLGLIFGAILARKVGEFAAKNNISLNYALVGAAGYSGLMVWHGGISGSAPIKAAESGHLKDLMEGAASDDVLAKLPDSISFSETIFSPMNLTATVLLVLLVPLFMYWLGKRSTNVDSLPKAKKIKKANDLAQPVGMDRVDHSRWFGRIIGSLIFLYIIHLCVANFGKSGFNIITPNFINLLLFGLGMLLHQNIRQFLKAVDDAIRGASGILIQFPLYFGIMGLMIGSGLIAILSNGFVEISTTTSFHVFTYISAAIVNIFVPSGGGQWGVQGPIIIQSAMEIGASLPKSIMALAYGDQLTNMMQPFWALPLLGITGLKAKKILPYTMAMMLLGGLIFLSVLLIF